MNPKPVATTSRMKPEDRRELVLDAAVRAFARGGYAGTSTDAVAREAGVSQPYVVRIFGTKLDLFLEVFALVMERIGTTFADELASGPFDPDNEEDWMRLGATYTELLVDRDLLMVMMHGMVASGEPRIGAASRHCMAKVFTILTSTGCTDDQARDFIAKGMLLNVMLAMEAPDHLRDEEALAPLTLCAFGESLPALSAEGWLGAGVLPPAAAPADAANATLSGSPPGCGPRQLSI